MESGGEPGVQKAQPRWVRWRPAGQGRQAEAGGEQLPRSLPVRLPRPHSAALIALSCPELERGRESDQEGLGQQWESNDPDLDRRSRNWK